MYDPITQLTYHEESAPDLCPQCGNVMGEVGVPTDGDASERVYVGCPQCGHVYQFLYEDWYN